MTDSTLDTIQIHFSTEALWVLNLALAFVMFGIALDISVKDFKKLMETPKAILVGVLSQFIALPAITFLLVYLIQPTPSIALGMMMVAACPGGNVSNFISHLARANTALSVSLTAIATLLAVVMTPFNLQFWGDLYAPTSLLLTTVEISFFEMMQLVALLLLIPLILGMSCNALKPKLAKRLGTFFKKGSILFFIILVAIALFNNKAVFMNYIFYVFWIVLVHNLVAYSTGYSLSKLFALTEENTRSITIETGIQNSGLGLLLIFTFFDGLGGMALLTAFWGVWHLISGLIIGVFWSKKSAASAVT